jgi:hypothetical protein
MLYGRYLTDLGPLLLIFLLLRLEPLLVPDELLLHEEIVLDPLLLKEPQPALGVRGHARQLVRRVRSLHPQVTGHFKKACQRKLGFPSESWLRSLKHYRT